MGNTNKREEIDFANLESSAITEIMAEGNGEAKGVILALTFSFAYSSYIQILDSLNIRGQQIEVALQYCGNEIQGIINAIKSKDLGMINAINKHSQKTGFKHKAIDFDSVGKREFLD